MRVIYIETGREREKRKGRGEGGWVLGRRRWKRKRE
jgi:hypothetical protein